MYFTTWAIRLLFQPSSLQANGCCACVGLLEGLSLPLLRVLRNLHCQCMSKLAYFQCCVCVCVHFMCQYCFPFLTVPLLPCPSLQFTDKLLSRTVGTVVPHHLAGGQAVGGWLSCGVCSSSGTHAHNTHTHTLPPLKGMQCCNYVIS